MDYLEGEEYVTWKEEIPKQGILFPVSILTVKQFNFEIESCV